MSEVRSVTDVAGLDTRITGGRGAPLTLLICSRFNDCNLKSQGLNNGRVRALAPTQRHTPRNHFGLWRSISETGGA